MSWQLLIWNVFIWTFTGVMIYVTNSPLWWLVLPAIFTATQSASELVKAVNEANKNDLEEEIDEKTQQRIRELAEQMKMGEYRRERL